MEHGNGMATQYHAVAAQPDAHYATARRRLIRDEFLLVEARAPEWSEATVGRSGHRILIDARARREEAGYKIERGRRGAARDDDAANPKRRQQREVGPQCSHVCFGGNLDQVVEFVLSDIG